MKKIVLIGLWISACIAVQAEELTVSEFTISAGETKDIAINLTNSENWGGFQFDISFPDGISILEDEYGLYYEVTDRLKYKNGRNTYEMEVNSKQLTNGSYRFTVANSAKANISGSEGAVMYLRITASDAITTGASQVTLRGVVLSDVSGNAYYLEESTYDCNLQLSVNVSSLGYATFSWPKAVDFSGQEVQAFIATERTTGVLYLEPVTKVEADTGLLLKGSEGTYHPQTTTETTDDVTANLLQGTAYGTWTVTGTDVFVLSNLTNGRAGFYKTAEGLVIPQYRAYLKSQTEAREFIFDDETTDIIMIMETPESYNNLYTVSGQRIDTPKRQGIYINGRKKIIVK